MQDHSRDVLEDSRDGGDGEPFLIDLGYTRYLHVSNMDTPREVEIIHTESDV